MRPIHYVVASLCLLICDARSDAAVRVLPTPEQFGPLMRITDARFALDHVSVIIGDGSAPLRDRSIVVGDGIIERVTDAAGVPKDIRRIDLRGKTVMPGIVGMHDHLFYRNGVVPRFFYESPVSNARLYLGSGVTTIRTAGSVDEYMDIAVKHGIDDGTLVGPQIFLTSPYLTGRPAPFMQMHELSGPDDAERTVEYWASLGVTSFKVYTTVTRQELTAIVRAAHARHLTVLGHLCSIGFKEAADLGLDSIEHMLFTDAELVRNKAEDDCPGERIMDAFVHLSPSDPKVSETIAYLIQHHVALSATPAIYETFVPGGPKLESREYGMMTSAMRAGYLESRRYLAENPYDKVQFDKDMSFAVRFFRRGGLLMSGADPSYPGVIAGFADQRGIELLVEHGLTPAEAIRVATLNGATFLGIQSRVGTIEAGKEADIVVLGSDPIKNIHAIEDVEIVIRKGVGYDAAALVQSVRESAVRF